MEITPFTMYLFTRLDIILKAASFGLTVSTVAAITFVALMCWARQDGSRDDLAAFSRWLKVSIAAVTLFASVVILLPSTSAAAFIYVVPKVVNNERIQSIADDGLDAISALVKASNEYARRLPIPKNGASGKSTTSDTDK